MSTQAYDAGRLKQPIASDVVRMKRFFLCVFLAVLAGCVRNPNSTQIDGVEVYGNVHDVSVIDMHEAVAAATRDLSDQLAAIEVVSKKEMRAHLRSRDLGWLPLRRTTFVEPDGHEHPGWSLGGNVVFDIPEAMQTIQSANEIYAFPITSPKNPHRDDKQLRLLDPAARASLVHLIGTEKNWFRGFDNRIWDDNDPPNGVGFVFRHGHSELVLFFSHDSRAEGTFNGQNTDGSLSIDEEQEFERWKIRYAQPELTAKRSLF